MRRSSASAYADASRQMPRRAGQSAIGSCWSTKPPAAGPIDPADLPRGARERHVAAEQARLGEVGDERRVDRAVQALAEREHGRRRCRRRSPPRAVSHVAAGPDREERAGPDDAHQREARMRRCPSTSFATGSCASTTTPREDEPDARRSRARSRAPCSSRTAAAARTSRRCPAPMKTTLSSTYAGRPGCAARRA